MNACGHSSFAMVYRTEKERVKKRRRTKNCIDVERMFFGLKGFSFFFNVSFE